MPKAHSWHWYNVLEFFMQISKHICTHTHTQTKNIRKQTEHRILTVKRRLISFAIWLLHCVVCVLTSCEPQSGQQTKEEEVGKSTER